MPKFQKKPVIIEAIQLKGNASDIMDWVRSGGGDVSYLLDDFGPIWIDTLEGQMKATQGDWIIKGLQGEYYPCKPDIFAESYELVEGT